MGPLYTPDAAPNIAPPELAHKVATMFAHLGATSAGVSLIASIIYTATPRSDDSASPSDPNMYASLYTAGILFTVGPPLAVGAAPLGNPLTPPGGITLLGTY